MEQEGSLCAASAFPRPKNHADQSRAEGAKCTRLGNSSRRNTADAGRILQTEECCSAGCDSRTEIHCAGATVHESEGHPIRAVSTSILRRAVAGRNIAGGGADSVAIEAKDAAPSERNACDR